MKIKKMKLKKKSECRGKRKKKTAHGERVAQFLNHSIRIGG